MFSLKRLYNYIAMSPFCDSSLELIIWSPSLYREATI